MAWEHEIRAAEAETCGSLEAYGIIWVCPNERTCEPTGQAMFILDTKQTALDNHDYHVTLPNMFNQGY